jgi:hypothetical protein
MKSADYLKKANKPFGAVFDARQGYGGGFNALYKHYGTRSAIKVLD